MAGKRTGLFSFRGRVSHPSKRQTAIDPLLVILIRIGFYYVRVRACRIGGKVILPCLRIHLCPAVNGFVASPFRRAVKSKQRKHGIPGASAIGGAVGAEDLF